MTVLTRTPMLEVRRTDGVWDKASVAHAAELPVGTVFREDGGRPHRVEPPLSDDDGGRYFTVSRVAG